MIRLKYLMEQIDDSVLQANLKNKPQLIPLYQEIEKALGDKFTQKHFDDEKRYSGGLKDEAGGLNSKAVQQFNAMKTANGLKSIIQPNSYRDYKKQKDTFLKYATDPGGKGGKISKGLSQAALPGFSQHHTGKAFDVTNSRTITNAMLKQYGFSRPYVVNSGFRIEEPWHIFYNG